MCILFQPDSVSQHAENKHPLSVQKFCTARGTHKNKCTMRKKNDDISQIIGSCT